LFTVGFYWLAMLFWPLLCNFAQLLFCERFLNWNHGVPVHRVTTATFWHHSIMMEKLTQAGPRVWVHAHPLSLYLPSRTKL
jgi:hypothetical protein